MDELNYLEDGTLFDSSHKHGRPFQFVIGSGRVIKGWDQGLIKPNSNLIFHIEMLEVRPRED